MILLLLALLALAVWLGLTWYYADDEPALGPAGKERVTFKQVVQNAIQDVREICAPTLNFFRRIWVWASPKLVNPSTWAAVLTNFALLWPTLAADPIGQALLARYPLLYTLGAVVALLATRRSGSPTRIPAPVDGPLVNHEAIRRVAA
jgi:hypothetical protein